MGILVLALALCPITCPIPGVHAADLRGDQLEARMVQLVNADRARYGLAPLASDPSLAAAARAHSADMVQSGFFSHTSPNTGDPEQRLARAGIAWRAYAENISYNSSVEASQASLMQSPAHRTNLLNPAYDTIGIGIVSNGRSLFVTQKFIKASGSRSRAGTPVAQPLTTFRDPAPVPVTLGTPQTPGTPRRKTRRFRIPGF